MITERQKEKARIFSTMHKEDKMFVLPNAWDAGSAYIFENRDSKLLQLPVQGWRMTWVIQMGKISVLTIFFICSEENCKTH